MWIMTEQGFFSVVAAKNSLGNVDLEKMVVRARVKEHLTALKARFPVRLSGSKILEHTGTDYPFRIVVSRRDWKQMMIDLAGDVTYTNFKDQVTAGPAPRSYLAFMYAVWALGRSLEMEVEQEKERLAGARYPSFKA